MMAELRRLYASLMMRVNALTPRERAALALLGAVAAAFAAFSAFDWSLRAGDRELEMRQRRADLDASLARNSDASIQERIAVDTNKVWRWSIVESSPVLAQARAVDLVQALAGQAGMSNVELSALETEERAPSIKTLRVRMVADFDWLTFLNVLEAMGNSDTSMFVEAVSVDASGEQAPRVSVTFAAPFIEDAPS